MPHRLPHTVLAALLVVLAAGTIAWARQRATIAPDWHAQSSLPLHRSSVEIEGAPPIDLQIASSAGAAAIERLRDTAHRALRIFSTWLGPIGIPAVTVVDLPWHLDAPGAAYPGVAATRSRWLAPQRDLVAERALVAGLARQYWPNHPSAPDPWFREGLVIYTATRGIHTALEGRNFAAPRFLGGFVSFPLRALLLSPSPQGPRPTLRSFDEVVDPPQAPWRYAPAGEGGAARRTAAALSTLERTIGWPAMQQALLETRARAETVPLTPELLADVVAEQRGTTMQWFARDVVRGSDAIDYAIGDVRSGVVDGRNRTTVGVTRLGGVFAATDHPLNGGQARSLSLLVRFEDGTSARTSVDGRDASTELVFDSAAPAVMVMLDPDGLMLMDADRSNNGRLLKSAPVNRIGVRMVLNWMLWLQNVMLSYTAIA